jgi:hypothetical protein
MKIAPLSLRDYTDEPYRAGLTDGVDVAGGVA